MHHVIWIQMGSSMFVLHINSIFRSAVSQLPAKKAPKRKARGKGKATLKTKKSGVDQSENEQTATPEATPDEGRLSLQYYSTQI